MSKHANVPAALRRLETILTNDGDDTAYGEAWRIDPQVQRDAACVVRYVMDLRRESYCLVGYMLTVRLTNTDEWLDGLVEYLNDWAAEIGEPDRVGRVRDELRIVRAATQQEGE
jgi:hypothetical protein